MAASNSYFMTRFLSGDAPGGPDFELDESDVWNVSVSPDSRKPVPVTRVSKRSTSGPVNRRREVGGTAASVPVSVPDWAKILKEGYTENRRRESDDDEDDYNSGGEEWIPPHEYLMRTRMASFSVQEGNGRTLKGRDLSRVRNAIWKKTGFEED